MVVLEKYVPHQGAQEKAIYFSIDQNQIKNFLAENPYNKHKLILEYVISLEVGDQLLIRKHDGFEIIKIQSIEIQNELMGMPENLIGKVKHTEQEFMTVE